MIRVGKYRSKLFSLALCMVFLSSAPAYSQEENSARTRNQRFRGWGMQGKFFRGNGTGRNPRQNAPPTTAITEPIDHGFVIIDGHYMPPPYRLQVEEGVLKVNGTEVHFRAGRGINGQGLGWLSNPRFAPAVAVAQLEKRLRENGMLLKFEDTRAVLLYRYSAVEVLTVLLDDSLSRKTKIDSLVKLDLNWMNSSHWGGLVDVFQPAPGLQEKLVALRQELKAEEKARQESLRQKMEGAEEDLTYARVGGVLSVVLAACAIGVLMTHVPGRDGRLLGRDDSAQNRRRVLLLVAVLVVLNLFDLACTLAAAQAGSIYELNPLVEQHLASPAALTIFKLSLLGVGCAVLVAFWRYRLTQLASWWAALCYTVITLRWATFNSVYLQ